MSRDADGLTPTTLNTVDPTRKLCTVGLADTQPGWWANPAVAQRLSPPPWRQPVWRSSVSRRVARSARFRWPRPTPPPGFSSPAPSAASRPSNTGAPTCSPRPSRPVSAARHVAAGFDAGAPDRAADLALAQAFCSDAFVFVAATNIQVHGGIGFTWEHPAHLYLRRARTDAQLLGDPPTTGNATCG